ncbi:MAG: alanine--tRNA ligase [Candidatus Latescibacteria bacterium]|nr:alanine--tRNA ligase [Candidatus Latescibacterota bacterium]
MQRESDGLRRLFIDFFNDRGHPHLPQAPLVPLGDPTLLFTSAGMVPFKPIFSSPLPPPHRRAVTVQRCLRLTDVELVGVTVRHMTLFEMLGNFSFGDYFKKEAIEWAWEFTTDVLGMQAERLYPSVYRDDQEAFDLWAKHIGLGAKRVTRLDEKDNFWGPAGGSGACGPCSEIYWDQGKGVGCGRPDCAPGCECERYLEFWNLVFPQFDQAPTGERTPLANRGIDTGMGLERLAMILQGSASVFENDLLLPIGDAARRLGSAKAAATDRGRRAARVITDHARALVFAYAEGVRPSNEGRGYVVRRLLRRAARFGRDLGIEGAFLSRLVPTVVSRMAGYEEYAYLKREESAVAQAILEEEERFAQTLEQGVARFEETAADLEKKRQRVFPGQIAFQLYDTFGFPIDLTAEMAAERGLDVDLPAYEAAMEEQRERARKAARFAARQGAAGEWLGLTKGAHSKFVGYDRWDVDGVRIRDSREVPGAEGPPAIEFVLDVTPFYAEAGGQVADTGVLESAPGSPRVVLRVVDVYKDSDRVIHRAEWVEGSPATLHAGPYRATVDALKRAATQRNHTATHLLHAALRHRFGAQLKQAGSLVAPDRLRFDFTHARAMAPEDLRAIEALVNGKVLEDLPVETETTSLEEAQEKGAMALFGEKYGERVRQVVVPGFSRELCGGCHVRRTGEIGYFRIESEAAIASGTRRIEALTGAPAYRRAEEDRALLRELSARLGATPDRLVGRVADIQRELREANESLAKQSREGLKAEVERLIEEAARSGDPPLIVAQVNAKEVQELRDAADVIRGRLPRGAAMLAAEIDGKLSVVATAGAALVSAMGPDFTAPAWAGDAVSIVQGKGGGRPELAVAGARDASRIRDVLERGRAYARARLKAVDKTLDAGKRAG